MDILTKRPALPGHLVLDIARMMLYEQRGN
jgi:hypothetical protein